MRLRKLLLALVLLLTLTGYSAEGNMVINSRQGVAPISAECRPDLTQREARSHRGYPVRFLEILARSVFIYTDPFGLTSFDDPSFSWVTEILNPGEPDLSYEQAVERVQNAIIDVGKRIKIIRSLGWPYGNLKAWESLQDKLRKDLQTLQGTTGVTAQSGKGLSELHHIASDKAIKSGFTEAYEAIFKEAGMTLKDPTNIVDLVGHSGGHTVAYKQYVLDYLKRATSGLTSMESKNAALKSALNELKEQLLKNPRMPYKGGL